MNKIATICFTLAAALVLASCETRAEGEAVSTNGDLRVERLTEIDGCTIYRFRDGTRYHYTTICRQGAAVQPASMHSTWTESCGKNCTATRDEQIDTVTA